MSIIQTEELDYPQHNHFNEIEGIEGKIVSHLLQSTKKSAKTLWKLLKYDGSDVLTNEEECKELTLQQKLDLIEGYSRESSKDSTESTRVFIAPFIDDAWKKQASSIYIYIDSIYPLDKYRSVLNVAIECVTHSKINTLRGDALYPGANPNEEYSLENDKEKRPVVSIKSRESVLVKCVLDTLNGIYIDGIGCLEFAKQTDSAGSGSKSGVDASLYNRRSFYGHKIIFSCIMSSIEDNEE